MPIDADRHPQLLRTVRSGDRPVAAEYNGIVEDVNRKNTGIDQSRQLPTAAELNLRNFQRFRIKCIEANFFVCRTWNGVEEGDNSVNVARSILLRNSLTERNGFTFTYTDNVTRVSTDSDSNTETQVIVPAYVINDQIFAFRNIGGGTGVVNNAAPPVPVVWVDLNVDARAWAKEA